MIFWKSKNVVLVLLLAAMFGMYGCASQQSQVVVEEKSVEATPDYTASTSSTDTGYSSSSAGSGYSSGSAVSLGRSSGAFPTGDRATSVIFIEKTVPSETQVGHSFDFITKVTNLTDAVVKDVVVKGELAPNFEIASSDPGVKGDASGAKVYWELGDLGPRETKVITVQGAPTSTESMEFCCTEVTYDYDPSLCMTSAVVQPELQITKEGPSEVSICDTIPYRIVVSNTGTGAAQNVQINDPLPSGLSTMSGETSVIRDVGTLHAGESREITVDVKADRTGTFDNAASAVASGGLSANSNSTSTLVTQPVLTITKTGPEKRYLGRNITYSIKVTNEGNGPAVNTTLDDCIPTNTSMVSVSDGGTITGKGALWNLGTLQPQESREVSVTVRADSKGEAENCAVASSECADAVTDCATTLISGIPAILLEVIDIADPIEVGGIETYEIRVTNQGSATDTNISIVCTLEEGTMEYVSTDGPTTASVVGNTVTFDHLASLAPKATVTWRVNVRAVAEGDVRFGVSLKSDQLTRSVNETESTNFYQ
ncbi:MAG: hypothetical protein SCALA701_33670 [Candidatus Scalindua sp.]|nr:DUF11 domain-containing protein [Planctomycetota bacterium]GJQ60566.1 MAG: hypothetical protein SCALA701_33670 [Candidatus Scalindua sp.]